MGYKAVSRLKLDDGKYIERGEDVSESDVDDFDALIEAGAVMEDEQFDATFPEQVLGVNQASGTPSNLEQVEGTELQVNPPEDTPDDQKPPEFPTPANPADPPKVDGAVNPGDGSDSHGQDVDEEDDDDSDEE